MAGETSAVGSARSRYREDEHDNIQNSSSPGTSGAGEQKRADSQARARAESYFASGSESSSTQEAGSCGRGSSSFGQSIDVSNRAAVGRALKRLAVLDATPSMSPHEHAALKTMEPALRAAEQRFARTDAARGAAANAEALGNARIEAVVRASVRPDAMSLDELTNEIGRLRAASSSAGAGDTALKSALGARLTTLVDAWGVKARAAGMNPPAASFDPYTARNRDLESAYLWTNTAGTVPLEAAMHDGGAHFRQRILEAIALRSSKGDALIAAYGGDPKRQRLLLEHELHRLGEPRCTDAAANEQLIARRAELLAKREAMNKPSDRTRYIGLDGKQGTLQSTVDYEIEQRIVAMNTTTSTGSLAAGAAAARGESIEDIRKKGAFGDRAETTGSAVGGVDALRSKMPHASQ